MLTFRVQVFDERYIVKIAISLLFLELRLRILRHWIVNIFITFSSIFLKNPPY